MAGVEVRFAMVDGVPYVVTRKVKGSKLSAQAAAEKAIYLVERLRKSANLLDRITVSYAPRPWENALQVGGGANAVIQISDQCSYDDFEGYYCTGGGVIDNGGGGGIGGGGSIGGGGTSVPVEGNAADDYPGGNDNGDGPLTGVGGSVTIPYPIPAGCVVNPEGLACKIVGQKPADPNAIAPVVTPTKPGAFTWPDIDWSSWCRKLGLCGNDKPGAPVIPSKPVNFPTPARPIPVESYHDDPTYQEDLEECQKAYERDWDLCQAVRLAVTRSGCLDRVALNNEWCLTDARNRARDRMNSR